MCVAIMDREKLDNPNVVGRISAKIIREKKFFFSINYPLVFRGYIHITYI